MARLILTGGPEQGLSNFGTFEITGTNSAETIYATQNAKATFDGSFSRGNDTIVIDGIASTYSIRLVSTNTAQITNATGASLTIPVGTGVTIKFADADARTLSFNTSGTAVLGTQALSGTAVTVAAGSGGNNGGGGTGSEIDLNFTRDVLTGTASADTFRADIVQNNNGEQTNSLGTGDRLEGLGGVDRLNATVQEASALNGSPGSAIAPSTNSVEEIYVAALHALTGSLDSGRDEREWSYNDKMLNLGVQINARDMKGVTDFGSVDSDASLTFYNVNTLNSGSVIGDDNGRITAAMTVRMDHSGPSSPNDDAANLTVLFDNDYLLREAPTEAGSQLRLQLLDIDNQINSSQPLRTNPFDQLRFTRTINGVVETFTISYNPTSTLTNKAAYDELTARINAALDANPALSDLNAVVTTAFTVVDPDGNPGGPASGFNIVITNSGPGQLDAVGFLASGIVPPNTDYQKQVFAERPSLSTDLITVDIELEKVGRSGDGGYLTVGGMAQTPDAQYAGTLLENALRNGTLTEEPGIERFNVKVEGNAAQPSSLAGLQSTHNSLVYVEVTNPGSTASLTIGNSNTEGNDSWGGISSVRNNAVKDVLIFDASAFTADSTVWAHFSEETTTKYLNLMDSQGDARADNVDSPFLNARYSFGGGDNVLNLNVSKSNVEYMGAITREDFELDIDMGAGDDVVQLQFGNGQEVNFAGEESSNNWFFNHVVNEFRYVGGTAIGNDRYLDSQVNIYTQSGNDSVELWGSTAAHVELGDGNDVAYTDNSGSFAQWVFNEYEDNDNPVNDLQSQPRLIVNTPDLDGAGSADTTTGVNNIRLTVSFQDITSSVFVSGYTGANATGSVVSSTASSGIRSLTDLQINQAIKDAINNHPVLSLLLIARDGPSGTLIVDALVDGAHVDSDLFLSLTSTPLTAGQTGRLLTAGETSNIGFDPVTGLAIGGLDNAVNPLLDPSTYVGATNDDDRWYSDFGNSGGSDSSNSNVNVIEGGTGNDVIVLSTDAESTETIDIDGVFTTATGRDTILNFGTTFTRVTTGGTPETQLIAINPETVGGTATTSSGTITFDISRTATTDLTIAPISFASGTPLTTLANAVANAINSAPSNAGAVTATVVGDDVQLQYNLPGNVPQSTIVVASTGTGSAEVNTIVLSAPPSGTVNEGTAQLSFGGVSYNPIVVSPGETIDSVGARLAATVTGNATATYNAATDTITVTSSTTGPVLLNADVVFATGPDGAGDPLVDTFGTETAGVASASTGVVIVPTSPTEGTNPGTTITGGYDIFDVTTVIGSVATFVNDAPGNGAEPDGALYNEGARIEFATRNSANVTITDTVSLGDYTAYSALLPAATSTTSELTLIQNIARAADNAATLPSASGAVPILKSIVITVDTENVGHFYLITNGAAAGDATVELLGNVELAQYDDISKAPIGDWDLMTLTNFTPLTYATAPFTFGSI